MTNNYNSILQSNNIDLQSILNAINELPEAGGGGGESLEDEIITRNLESYTNDRVSKVGLYAFFGCEKVQTVSFPNCEIIEQQAFTNCSKLQSVSFPNCLSIGNSAFVSCVRLVEANFPECLSIGNSAFVSCVNLVEANFSKCLSLGTYAFGSCKKLTTIAFSECTIIGTYAFNSCLSLANISFPKCTDIYTAAFRCCTNLTVASFPKCTQIWSYAFSSCQNFSSLYLLGSSLCSLSHSNAFVKTGITSSTGSIIVPASLVTSYRTATNWTYFSKVIYPDADDGGNPTSPEIPDLDLDIPT